MQPNIAVREAAEALGDPWGFSSETVELLAKQFDLTEGAVEEILAHDWEWDDVPTDPMGDLGGR